MSLIDSLDTMWIMGFREEFDHAMEHVAQMNFSLPRVIIPYLVLALG